jgi:hypothetical protein
MADVKGDWKGLAVLRSLQSVVYLHLQQDANVLTGAFEASDLVGPNNKGDVTGSIDANNDIKLDGDSSGRPGFTGRLTGEGTEEEMIHGVVHIPGERPPVGTLTLFRQPVKPIFGMYGC